MRLNSVNIIVDVISYSSEGLPFPRIWRNENLERSKLHKNEKLERDHCGSPTALRLYTAVIGWRGRQTMMTG